MSLPSFYAKVPPLVVRDGLADFLGAADDGLLEYNYADVVRVAGHSCPTVAGAWLMACAALRRWPVPRFAACIQTAPLSAVKSK